MFPDAPQLTPGHISELKDCLVYSIGGMRRDFTSHLYSLLFVLDVSTSLTSTAPYSVEELRNLLALVEHLQVDGLGSVATYGKTICLHLIRKLNNTGTIARIMDRFGVWSFSLLYCRP